jgi:hypothetical protein
MFKEKNMLKKYVLAAVAVSSLSFISVTAKAQTTHTWWTILPNQGQCMLLEQQDGEENPIQDEAASTNQSGDIFTNDIKNAPDGGEMVEGDIVAGPQKGGAMYYATDLNDCNIMLQQGIKEGIFTNGSELN